MSARGVFITLEGLDGTGKSTQARLLTRWLRRHGLPVEHTREPGGTPVGQRLRRLLLHGAGMHERPVPEAELLLMMADRAQHVAQVLRPALERGAVVVCERYTDSSVAYQVYGCGMDAGLVDRLNEWVTGGLVPDLTFWLDLPVERRLTKGNSPAGGDHIESRGSEFFRRVREGYEALARRHAERIVRVEVAGKSPQEVQAELRAAVRQRLGDRLRVELELDPGWGL